MLKLTFQITDIPPDERSAEPDGDGRQQSGRFQYSSYVIAGGNKILDSAIAYEDLDALLAPLSASHIQLVMNQFWNDAETLGLYGTTLRRRFERTGDLADIANAISANQRAVQLTPDGHADMPSLQNSLGNSFLCLFQYTGNLENITNAISAHQRAVQRTPIGHAEMPGRQNNLGTSFARRFQRAGALSDIANAISAHQRAVQLTPNSHADMPGRQNSLGNSFMCRFQRTGDLLDIANAISAHQRAVQLTPNGHATMPRRQSSLGNSFSCRFQRTHDLADSTNAISAHQMAVRLTPNGHADMASRQNNLGNSFLDRLEYTGDPADVANAISAHQMAVQLTPTGHADMPSRQNNLGNSFSCRFQRTGELADISNAISAHQKAVELAPSDHADLPSWQSNLGNSFLRRFESTGNLVDIASAISAHEKAVQLTPNGHAYIPSLRNSLGRTFSCRFQHTGDILDINEAISNFQQSATYGSGSPSARLTAARSWAALSLYHNPAESLHAYAVVIGLLSQIAGMDRTIQQRHSTLIDISNLTAAAASAAFAQEEVGMALEWLEQGRCLVWSQINQLRSPVDELRAHNKLLADRFLDVSRALESSSSRQQSPFLATSGTMLQRIALEDETQTHIKYAQEWGQLLDEIRNIPGFYDFLRPRRASSILNDLPQDGAVIVINVHENRCDALAMISDCEPLHIPLHSLTHHKASTLRDQLRTHLSHNGYRMRNDDRGPREVPDPEATSKVQEVLQELWLCVVKPILDGLAYSVSLVFIPVIT